MHALSSRWSLLLTGAVLFAFTALAPRQAQADIVVGVDGQYAFPTSDWLEKPGAGFGVQGRLGYELPLPFVSLVFEGVGRFQPFAADESIDYDSWQAGGGLRAGFGIPGVGIEPVAFFHAGYGSIEGVGGDYVIQHNGFAYELGGGLEYTTLPFVDVGLHASYNQLTDDEDSNPSVPNSAQWLAVGLHLELNI